MPVRLLRRLSIAVFFVARPSATRRKRRSAPPTARVLEGRSRADVERNAKLGQEIVDSVFSFGELGFQEVETSRYLKETLVQNGFAVEEGIAGIPTAWMATWGSGKPVIALGSDIDGIPQASQKPGVAYHAPLIEGAPGHGEGHNSGQAVNILAAIAVKRIMDPREAAGHDQALARRRRGAPGHQGLLRPRGLFKDVDACLFTHVGDNLSTTWGASPINNGLVSVEFTFRGQSAHSAGRPWMGRSALDAVELMNAGWNFRREHLRTQQRSHYVITRGGDQPNVVRRRLRLVLPARDGLRPHPGDVRDRQEDGGGGDADDGRQGRVIRSWARPGRATSTSPSGAGRHRERGEGGTPEVVGRGPGPREGGADGSGSEGDERARRGAEEAGEEHVKDEDRRGGGSDDIGDISWNVPTVGGLVQNFPLDSIGEFNFETQRFRADTGRSNGGTLKVVTKSGTNEFRARPSSFP